MRLLRPPTCCVSELLVSPYFGSLAWCSRRLGPPHVLVIATYWPHPWWAQHAEASSAKPSSSFSSSSIMTEASLFQGRGHEELWLGLKSRLSGTLGISWDCGAESDGTVPARCAPLPLNEGVPFIAQRTPTSECAAASERGPGPIMRHPTGNFAERVLLHCYRCYACYKKKPSSANRRQSVANVAIVAV